MPHAANDTEVNDHQNWNDDQKWSFLFQLEVRTCDTKGSLK